MSLKTEIIETPDITLKTEDRFKEKLFIYNNGEKIKFTAHIDGVAQCWEIDKKTLLDAIK